MRAALSGFSIARGRGGGGERERERESARERERDYLRCGDRGCWLLAPTTMM